MSTEFAQLPRSPKTVRHDHELQSQTLRVWRRSVRPALIRHLTAWIVLGALVGLLTAIVTRGWAAPLLVALGFGLGGPMGLSLVPVLRNVRRIRARSGPGVEVTSGYDAEGRFLIQRSDGERVLQAGSASTITMDGEIALIRGPRCSPLLIVTPRELITHEDVDFLTRVHDPHDSVVISDEMHNRLLFTLLQNRLRDPGYCIMLTVLIVIGISAYLWLPLFAALLTSAVLATCHLVGLLLGFYAISRNWYPVGLTMSARLDDGVMFVQWPGHPYHIRLASIKRVHRTPDALVIRRAFMSIVLPRGLLSEMTYERLQQATGS